MDGMLKTCLASMAALFLAMMFFMSTTWHYKAAYEKELTSHSKLTGEVEQQKAQAAARLEELIRERDERQAMLDKQAAEQEEKDAKRLEEIERLTGELATRPVRVRVVAAPGGGCGGGAQSEEAGTAESSAGGAAPTYGVLPEFNSRRLAGALSEVERMSAAYSSCRTALMSNQEEGP